jgi:hypothetical protein
MNQQIYTFAVFMLFAASLTKFRQVERIRNFQKGLSWETQELILEELN